MPTPNLARIERVDLRDGWEHEARDFTPWLAQNIEELGDALGLDLESQQIESPVGSRSLDILATDRSDGRPVIIENQLNFTDNDHLSRLLIYAAGKDAKLVIWVSGGIEDEHRQVLDWLNQHTDEYVQFFGVVVELWKIDNSNPAPHFSVVAAPNDWRKSQVGGLGGGPQTSEQGETNRLLRREIDDKLRKHSIALGVTRNPTVPYRPLGYAVPYVRYTAYWQVNGLGIAMHMDKRGTEGKDWNQWLFQQLEAHREDIESEFAELNHSEQIIWEPTRTRIAIHRPGNVYTDAPESRDEYCNWIVEMFLQFRKVFTPLLKELVG